MQRKYGDSNEFVTVTASGMYNNSPIYQSKNLRDEDVVVWHFHGDSNARPDKNKGRGQRGVDLWWPIYQHCLRENIGGIAEWRGSVENKWLDRLESQIGMCG